MKPELSAIYGSEYHHMLLDAMPCPVLVVEEDVRIVDFNTAAGKILDEKRELVVQRRAGEMLHCLHSFETPEGCGRAPACRQCPVRNSVNHALGGQTPLRQTVKLDLVMQGQTVQALFLITVAPLTFEDVRLAVVILEDIREIAMLRQMIPICSNCKQVRTDENYWQSVESYLETHLDLDCTHSLCPSCAEKLFPEYSAQELGLGASTSQPPPGFR
ncbi:MAG: PAS domain-containing protein [Verrucomicrobiota bacterium]